MKRLSDIGEDALIARLVGLLPVCEGAGGPGDDCAVADLGGERLTLLKADAMVGGIHFENGADGLAVGWKAVARVISDFAAMGGVAERFLVTIALSATTELRWIEAVYQGMGKCLERYGARLAGGETCRVPEGSAAVISVSASGSVERGKAVLRSGGKPGDSLWVTGRLGGSLGGKHLSFSPRVEEARWLADHFGVTAMMDISDGLAKDLPRLAKASGCGFRLDHGALPLTEGCTVGQALCDGEDFELLLAAPAAAEAAGWDARFPGLGLTRIGRFVPEDEGDELVGGWDHFG